MSGGTVVGSHRVRRSQVTPDVWIRHRKLRKKIASAKWYATKKRKEIRQQHNHRDILEANLRDAANPEAPWNQIHALYEWAQWNYTTRDYSQVFDLHRHPHAPCLISIRYQIEAVTRPLMDSIWRNIPWGHPTFQRRLVQLCWRQHRQYHAEGHGDRLPPVDRPLPTPVLDGRSPVSDVPLRCSSPSSTDTCAWHTAWMASVPGVLYVALSLRLPSTSPSQGRHPSLLETTWRWLAHCLHHIYHPSNPKDIDPHCIGVQPDTNTHQPPTQTPIQKLQHIALQHHSMLNPRSILCCWIQQNCFPPVSMDPSMDRSSWWDSNASDTSSSVDSLVPNPPQPPTFVTQTPTPPPDPYWDDLRVSDCESFDSDAWLRDALDAESQDDDHHRLSLPDPTLSPERSTHSLDDTSTPSPDAPGFPDSPDLFEESDVPYESP